MRFIMGMGQERINNEIKKDNVLETNLRHAIDESSIVTVMSKDGIITHVNEKFCQVSGYSEKEIIGTSLIALRNGCP